MSDDILNEIAKAVGGKVGKITALPDGSGFATMSIPLPADHWLTKPGCNEPPAPFLVGTDSPDREALRKKIIVAAKYAIRAATMNGKENDFDPDAMVCNFVIGMLGYNTSDGLSHI